jgi:translation initiation factor IF-3
MDYSHYLYQQAKRDKLARKGSKQNVIKELKLTPKISEHDYQVRYRAAIKFIKKGYKVKMSVFFRGREITHPEVGLTMLDRMGRDLGEDVTIESPPKCVRNTAFMLLGSPK